MNRSLLVFILITFVSIHSLIIYRRTPKPKLVCREEHDWHLRGSNASAEIDVVDDTVEVRRTAKRSAPEHEPVIFLNTREPAGAADEDFDLVSDDLSEEEKKIVKQKLIKTCAALKLH
ncbi:hypothetical protein QR680_002577 [Steinernema hermaphroditum]|uniref:Uncharacterized protein n=1 Tax=Steinernema hermaphroditum TaxID=289476 RepID=A0AA39LID2_9BILA|nr:hypothetical protein QR680_002577 [Steinernema hermaphroditum]